MLDVVGIFEGRGDGGGASYVGAIKHAWKEEAEESGGAPGLTSFNDVKQDRAESSQEPRSRIELWERKGEVSFYPESSSLLLVKYVKYLYSMILRRSAASISIGDVGAKMSAKCVLHIYKVAF